METDFATDMELTLLILLVIICITIIICAVKWFFFGSQSKKQSDKGDGSKAGNEPEPAYVDKLDEEVAEAGLDNLHAIEPHSKNEWKIQSELNFVTLHNILQWIDMNALSCAVVIMHGDEEEMTFLFDSGRIVHATSLKPGSKLSEFLMRSGELGGPQIFRALNESRKTGVSLARYLVEKNLISILELTAVLTKLVEALLIDAFSSKTGTVSVTSPLPEMYMTWPVQLETGQAIMDVLRVLDEMERDKRKRVGAIVVLNKRLYNEDFKLPVMPGVMAQLVSLLSDQNSTFHDMAMLIMTDQVLMSNILKIANSAYYGGPGQVDSLQFAIVRIGMREVVNVVTAIQVSAMKSKDVPKEQLKVILDNSLKMAFMASGLARTCHLDSEVAFLGGLLLDLGKTVILSVAKDYKIDKALLDDLLNTRHAEIGALIANKWNYPESIQRLIRYHHSRSFGGITNKMIDLIQIADQTIQTNGEGELDADQLQSLNLSNETVLDSYTKAMDAFGQIKR